jgi:hypothetical protein
MTLMPGHDFQISACAEKDTVTINSMTNFFPGLIEEILEFFDTKCPPVVKEDTIEIVSILEAGIKAQVNQDSWIDLA